MARNIDISLARAFVAVSGSGNMTAAAAKLGLTQGAVSQQIKRLEEALQCILFDRSRRGLQLTRQGEQLLGYAKRLLALNDEIWKEMTEPAITGEVRLGMPFDLVTPYLPLVMEGFGEANPRIDVSMVCATSTDLQAALNQGKLDVAIIEQPLGKTGGESEVETGGECLAVERLLWIGRKDGRAHRKRPLPLSLVSDTCAFRAPLLEALQANDIAWRSVFEFGTLEASLTTVRADLAVTASLASLIPSDMEVLGREAGLPELPSFAINLYQSDIDPSPAAREVASYLRDGIVARNRISA